MKSGLFAPIAAVAAIAGSAAAQQIQLSTASDFPFANNLGVNDIHEGAAINYVELTGSGGGSKYQFDEAAGTITRSLSVNGGTEEEVLTLTVSTADPPVLYFQPGETTTKFSFDTDELQINGTGSGLYACKNINDPYQFSKDSFFAVFYGTEKAKDDCYAITIHGLNG